MDNEKKKTVTDYGLYYSYEQDETGSCTYHYPYCYVVTEDILLLPH